MPQTGSIRERLLHRGNIACPLCLSVFGDGDSQPTVEHIPPKAMGGRPMCLICESCRSRTSRTDNAKINIRRSGPRLSLYIDGQRQYGAVSMDGAGNIRLAARAPLPEIQTGSRLTLKAKLKELLDVSASELRVAYLTIFSLLGPWGYLFAQSATGVALRCHILEAERKAVVRVGGGAIRPGHVALFDDPAFCWGVGTDPNSAILIPRHHEADLAAVYSDGDTGVLSGWSVPYGEFGCRQSCAVEIIPSREIRRQQLRLTVGEHIFHGLLAGFIGADYTILIGDLAGGPPPGNAKEIAKIALDYPQLPAGQFG